MKANQILNLVFIVGIISACSKESHSPQTPPAPETVDIYLTGIRDINQPNKAATYWKNETPVDLTDGTKDANALDIVVSEGDVYVAGTEQIAGSPNHLAMIWKNNTPIPLTDATEKTHDAVVLAIAVSNGTIFAAGIEYDGSSIIAKYWRKTGQSKAEAVNIGGSLVFIDDLAVSGNDVYVVGSEVTNGVVNARCWKNGINVPLPLENAMNFSTASGIAISGGDVYVVGYEKMPNQNNRVKYWRNGVATNVSDGTVHCNAYDIDVSNNDVYIAGNKSVPGGEVVMYWKNGVPVELTSGSHFRRRFTSKFAVTMFT